MERSLGPVVVFDLGGVLVPPEGSIDDLAVALDVPPEAMAAAYWRPRDAYDRGGSPEDFWGAVTAELGRSADVAMLDRIDAARWSRPGPGVPELLADLTAAGTRLAVLSNAPSSLAAVVRSSPWSAAFDILLFSSDVGVMKPEPAVYALAQQRFGVPTEQLLFLDDRPVNVEGARRAGWGAHVWTDPAGARALLRDAGALDA